MAGYGFAATPDGNGNSPLSFTQQGNPGAAVGLSAYRVPTVLLSPVTGQGGGYNEEPNTVFWAGVGLAAVGWVVSKIAPSTKRMGFKLGRHHKLSLT